MKLEEKEKTMIEKEKMKNLIKNTNKEVQNRNKFY